MADFDYGALMWHTYHRRNIYGDKAAATYLREQIEAEVARLREALQVLRDLPIVENDNPDTLHLDGEPYTGPVVDYLFRIVRKIKEVARQAIGDAQ